MSLTDLLLGRPLATREEGAERIGPAAGIPIFGLDALSSAAYGPEAALTLLIPLGLAGVGYIVPITASIIALLAIVYLFLQFLHNQRGSVLKALLYLKGNQRIIVINASWYLKS
jgi:hypothetical protein